MKPFNYIEKPDYFNLEWYITQKEAKKTDTEIAEMLYVSGMTLHKWKKEIGWESGKGRSYCGRKRKVNVNQLLRLRKEGLSGKELAKVLMVSEVTVSKWLRRMGAV